jgi:Carboxypeptidase regulatory-like domain/TonB dependent receptor
MQMSPQAPKVGLRIIYSLVLAAFFTLVCGSPPARAQEAGGSIVGIISDPSGAAIGSANVTIKNVATGGERAVVTNGDGLFAVPNLIPGKYLITVVSPGFSTAVVSDVGLVAGERREVNVSMKLGQTSDKVTVVSSEISDVQLASSELRGVIDSHTVNELPLNGRDWTSLTLLEPGVAQVRTQKALGVSNDRPNRGLGTDVTIGGNRPQGNNYRLDGVSINDYSSGAPGSITGGVLGVDAVQEFSVVTSNAPADYGKTSGGVINAASRSGTNAFHGSAYEFLRNSKLDARNFFDTLKDSSGNSIVPPFKRNQFGASAGGPILKDRTFFFGDYEGLRQSLSQTNPIVVPSPNAHNGVLVGGTVPVDSKVAPFLKLFPLPNGPVTGDTGVFNFVGKQVTNEDFATGRMDHRISASDNLFGTYVFDRGQQENPDAYNFKEIGNQSRRHTFALEELHIFTPALVNTARFGFNRDVVIAFSTLSAINPAASDTSLGFNPGLPVGIITVGSGVTQFSGGLGAISEYRFHYNSFQACDDLFWSKNKHSLKVGFNAERIQANQFTQGASPNGFYQFSGLSNFLQNQPFTFQTLLSTSHTPRDLRQTIYSGYVQDDYKLRPNLTLNLGVRYEMATVPTETAGQLSTLINLTDAGPHLGPPYYSNPTLRNFAPRVGFSWDPFKTGKTSVRGAYGIYDVLPLPYQFELLTLLSQPFTLGSSTPVAPGDFPTVGFTKAKIPTNLRNAYVEPNPHRSYVQQWTLNVQRELFRNFTVTAGYVGSHGVHLAFHADEINQIQPTLSSAGYLWPTAGGTRLFPNIGGQVSAVMWSGSSTYQGFNLNAIKRLSHGFQIQGSYTYAKSIDTSSSGIAGDTFGNSVSSLPVFDPRLRRGLSDFDVRNVLAINAIWLIPGPSSWSGALRWAVSGWQVGGIYTVTSGLPFTPTIGGDPLGLKGADLFAFPNRVAGCDPVNSNFKSSSLHYLNLNCFALPTAPASITPSCNPKSFTSAAALPPAGQVYCSNLLGNSGRNITVGPGLQNFDFSLFKNNPVHRISETFNVQFRWEIFNLANHANFNPPAPAARQIFAASGSLNNAGVLTGPTITTSRQMQFAVKFIW